ncbi:MAG: S9 family peptidase [Euryhalocaulis sp.]|uniref:S9 family peptidase n=1 Tax=Euryhalocaulis sp. TaxID=2744307 RepID=UPI00180F9E55|nr:S9 family peptidase [Euryhalocaulis sp.]MBA4800279.1 S9 family peptidase [Euryhalocaulis sp.]
MKIAVHAALAAALLAPVAASAQDDDIRKFTAEDVFNLEWANDPQVSPDGETVAYVRMGYDKAKDSPAGSVWVVDVDSGAHRPLITGAGSYNAPRWSPDGRRLAYMAVEDGKPEMRVRYMDDGSSFSVAQLFQPPQGYDWSPDGRTIAFSMFTKGETPSFATPPEKPEGAEWAEPVRVFDDLVYRFDGQGWLKEGAAHIYVVPADGGSPRQLTKGDNGFGSPEWLDENTILAVGNDVENPDLDPIESEIYAISVNSGDRRALTTRDGPDGSPAVSPDGRRIAYTGYDDRVLAYQQTDLWVMDANGAEPRNLTADFDHSVSSPEWAANGRGVYVTAEVNGQNVLALVDLNGGVDQLADDVGGTSLGRPYASGGFSASDEGRRSVVAYTQGASSRPADLAILTGSGDPRRVTDLNSDALGHIQLAEIEEIQVESSVDGRTVEAWIAKPPGFTADGSYPMILEIHGGPFAMYTPHFAAEIQRYAAEGYVTVYANPRGSTGYGEDFALEIDRAYPGEDYDDLMSVVDAVVAKNYADPGRLFVTGGSGGGVLTSWIVGKTDRFAAAATIKPVINWTTMALAGDIAAFVGRHWMRAQPWEDPELYWRLSPISLVGNVTTPTLVMVGEEDYRTPAWEAEQFYGALKLQDVPTALIRVPGASHSIAARPSNLIAKTDNIMGWFAKYDPAKEDEAEGGDSD